MSTSQVNAKNVILLVGVMFVSLTCAGLAIWQYERAQEKISIEAQISHLSKQGVFTTDELKTLPKSWLVTGLKVSLSGLRSSEYWWLDNKIVDGQFGYDLIVALKPQDFQSWWLVNLGWFKGNIDRNILPSISLPHMMSVEGYLKSGNLKSFSLTNTPFDSSNAKRVQYLTPEIAQTILKHPVAPFIVYAEQADVLGQLHYKPLNMSADKHYAYALQWLLLSIAALVIGFFLYKRGKRDE